jgi:hypothetical protein
VTRFTLAGLALLFLGGTVAVALARLLGRSGSRGSILLSVVAHWLAAYVLWTFAGGLLLRAGMLEVYDGAYFALVALLGGIWHYRAHLERGRERALAVFVGAQLAWLAVVLLRNGLL